MLAGRQAALHLPGSREADHQRGQNRRGMAFRKIAVIYDDSLRPDTTGGYCLRALRSLTDVCHLGPARGAYPRSLQT
jgi:hypothetical protein